MSTLGKPLDPPLRLRRIREDQLDPERRADALELGLAVRRGRVLVLHCETGVSVAILRYWDAVLD